MKRFTAAVTLVALALISIPGCSETKKVSQEIKTTTPGGTTTTKIEKDVTTSGKNPPPAN